MADTPDQPTRPQPVITGYLITIITMAAAAFGVDTASDDVTKVIAAAAGLAVALASMWMTRDKVTPISDPVDATGTPLAPVDQAPASNPIVVTAPGLAGPDAVAAFQAVTEDIAATGRPVADVTATFNDVEVDQLTGAPPAPDDSPYLPLPPLPTLRGFASPGLYNEPDDAGVDH